MPPRPVPHPTRNGSGRDATTGPPRGRCRHARLRRRAAPEGGSGSVGRPPRGDALRAPAVRSRAVRARRGTGPRARDRTIRPSRTSTLLLDSHDHTEAQADADHPAVDEQLHRSLALSQDHADLGELEILAELQGHGRPLLWREVVNGCPDARGLGAVHDTVVDRACRIGDSDGAVEVRGRFAVAVMIIDGVDTDLIEPGAEGG